MSIERHYSLSKAADLIGVNRHTLKAWLVADLAMEFPRIARGSKVLIAESHLEALVRRRAPYSNFSRRRRLLATLQARRNA